MDLESQHMVLRGSLQLDLMNSSKLEMIDVNSFTERKLYTWCFLIAGAIASFYLFKSIPWRSGIPIYVCIACWFLSLFTLMPAEIPDNNQLVVSSGVIIIIIGIIGRWLDLYAGGKKYWLSICNCKLKSSNFSSLFYIQALLVALSSVMVYLSTVHRTEKHELLASHQLINWSVAGFSMVLPLFSENSLLSRLTSIFLGFAPPFLLLSIGYEAIFYAALALVLMAWILFENALLNLNIVNKSLDSIESVTNHLTHGFDNRSLQLSDVRIPLVFVKDIGDLGRVRSRKSQLLRPLLLHLGSMMEKSRKCPHVQNGFKYYVFNLRLLPLSTRYPSRVLFWVFNLCFHLASLGFCVFGLRFLFFGFKLSSSATCLLYRHPTEPSIVQSWHLVPNLLLWFGALGVAATVTAKAMVVEAGSEAEGNCGNHNDENMMILVLVTTTTMLLILSTSMPTILILEKFVVYKKMDSTIEAVEKELQE
ncbi:mcd4, partial [Mucuna pruriens]